MIHTQWKDAMSKAKNRNIVVGIDFDGTLAAREPYPAIGRDLGAAPWLHGLVYNQRVTLVLWTMREGEALCAALKWCNDRSIYFKGVNGVPGQSEWADVDGHCRKQHFNILVDDCALGVPLVRPVVLGTAIEGVPESGDPIGKPYVDWNKTGPTLIRRVSMWLDAHPEED